MLGLLCALLLQTWGGALAAVVCPHAGRDAAPTTKAGEHSCCAARPSDESRAADAGSDDAAGHCPMSRTRAASDEGLTHDAADSTATGDPAALLTSPPCTHCVGRPDRPPTPSRTREPQEARRDAPAPATRAHTTRPAPVLFASAVEPSQHAPPGLGARRHVLLSVFLI